MERELHYGPHAASERLRVAHELVHLPRLAEEFRAGELCFSAIRELTRVVTPETEGVFLERARGKTARQVEQLVSGLKRGALPGDRPDPRLVTKKVFLELDAEAFAVWRRMRIALDDELGSRMTDSELAHVVARRAGARAADGEGSHDHAGEPDADADLDASGAGAMTVEELNEAITHRAVIGHAVGGRGPPPRPELSARSRSSSGGLAARTAPVTRSRTLPATGSRRRGSRSSLLSEPVCMVVVP